MRIKQIINYQNIAIASTGILVGSEEFHTVCCKQEAWDISPKLKIH